MNQKSKISGFQFENPILTKLNYSINPEGSKKIENIQTNIKVDNSSMQQNQAIVALYLKMGNNNTAFSVEIEMQSKFKWDDSFNRNQIENLLHQNAPALLLSYMRPLVSETTGYGFNSVMLPFIDFSSNNKNHSDA